MTDEQAMPTEPAASGPAERRRPARRVTTRRAAIGASFGAVAGMALGGGVAAAVIPSVRDDGAHSDPPAAVATGHGTVDAYGTTQAGIARPDTPQPFNLTTVVDLADPENLSFLPALGRRIAELVSRPPPSLLPDGSMRLTATVGLGPRVVAAVDSRLPGAAALPAFHGDENIPARADGGDVLIVCCGGPDSKPSINAKHADGAYLIPLGAHVRVANPVRIGRPLMLRRGYGYDNGPGESGLLFTCFQNELRTFVVTQQQLDLHDKLMAFAEPTGSATFLILPGFTATRPLGAALAG